MTKKEFYALPVAPDPEMELPKYTETETSYNGVTYTHKHANRKYTARIVEGMLEITGYKADGTALWRTWQDEDRVFGQTLGKSPKPSESTVASRKQWNEVWHGTSEADETIHRWVEKHHWPIPKDKTGLCMAAWSQTKIRHKKRDEKWDRIRQEIDNEMLAIRTLPKDFERWLVMEVFRDHHYLVYQYRKGTATTTAVCTRCGQVVTVKDHRNRQPGRCPRCHVDVTCISEKSLAQTNGYIHTKNAAYLQPTREGFCLRRFNARMKINAGSFRNVKAEWTETDRRFYDFALDRYIKHFTWKEFKSSGEIRWCKTWSDFYGDAEFYHKNLKKLFSGTAWKYIPMEELARHCGELETSTFISETRGNLGIEHLAKHSFWKLARDKIKDGGKDIAKARSIREAMGGLPMDEIRMLRKADPDQKKFDLYLTLRGSIRVTQETLTQMTAMGFQKEPELLLTILRNATWRRTERYIKEQREQWPKENRYDWNKRRYRDMPPEPLEVAREWRDYLRDAGLLGWDLSNDFVVFPRDLRKAHRQTIKEMEDKSEPERHQIMQRVLENQKIFSWESKDYLIRPPESGREITAEGHALHHCVGRYVESVAKGRSVILFIRKNDAPDVPLVTVELDPDSWKVRQARGANNAKPPEGVRKFLEKWKLHLQGIRQKQKRKAG